MLVRFDVKPVGVVVSRVCNERFQKRRVDDVDDEPKQSKKAKDVSKTACLLEPSRFCNSFTPCVLASSSPGFTIESHEHVP